MAVPPTLWRACALGLVCLSPLLPDAAPGARRAVAAPPPPGAASSTPTLGAALQPSSAQQLALVDHLRRTGVVFYGAWWCPACFRQKNLFGQEAGNQLPYVECEKTEEQRQRCTKVGIGAYPTWVLGSQKLEGVQTLERLAQWSGFRGSMAPSDAPAAGPR
jgi:hypothetical protein